MVAPTKDGKENREKPRDVCRGDLYGRPRKEIYIINKKRRITK